MHGEFEKAIRTLNYDLLMLMISNSFFLTILVSGLMFFKHDRKVGNCDERGRICFLNVDINGM